MTPEELCRRCLAAWVDRLDALHDVDWDAPTPCADWSVRELVNHVAGEDLWAVPLLAGSTVEEVGDRLDGDLLGDDPVASARAAAGDASEALTTDQATVHLSYGEERTDEYLLQLAADHLVHGWDLAAATGGQRAMDDELVAAVGAWFSEREEIYRSAGAIGPRAAYDGTDAAGRLLATFGRDPAWSPGVPA